MARGLLKTLLTLLLTALTLATQAKQDRIEPPLRSSNEEEAWLKDDSKPKIRLGARPRTTLPVEPVIGPAQRRHILTLIRRLAKINDPDYFESYLIWGVAFAPIDGERNEAVLELIRLGPKALPFLLQHLDDPTPTGLILKATTLAQGKVDSHNPLHPREGDLHSVEGQEMPATVYTVRIGDLCFNIIGRIVGRTYQFYRSSGLDYYILLSPVSDPDLARRVRRTFSSKTPARHLFQWFLADYSCRGVYSGFSLAGWDGANYMKVQAAQRLLYYFPKESIPFLVERLNGLRVEDRSQERSRSVEREIANDIRTGEFLSAVSWSKSPKIQAALFDVFQRATDLPILRQLMPLLEQNRWPLVRQKMRAAMVRCPALDIGWYGGGFAILEASYQFAGEKSRPLFTEFLRDARSDRFISVCQVLKNTDGRWDRDFLMPMLSDRRRSDLYDQWRVCDIAAEILAYHRPSLFFDPKAMEAERDRQIRAMQDALEGLNIQVLSIGE